ncbi:hypothetical protein [Streptomyces tropicalis]|uniref:hypothetical protein n=1 Tax=Streptomyces tropicalis TaxID=3034234 RepID=UPI003F68AE59
MLRGAERGHGGQGRRPDRSRGAGRRRARDGLTRDGLARDGLVRAARFTGRTLRAEWHGIVVDPVRRLMHRGLSGLVLAFVAAFGVIFFHALAQRPAGEVAVRLVGGVRADLPLWLALSRTPVSLYVPALDLPVWAGITQLFLAFALAELTLGRGRTLFVSYATTLAGTLTVRVMVAMGPGRWGLGLPPEIGQVLDTGPSAAVVGLFTYLSVVRRAPVVFVLTGGSMVWESIAKPNLAGREHLIAVAAAIVLGLLHDRSPARLLRRAGALAVRVGPVPRPAVGTAGGPTAPRPSGGPAPHPSAGAPFRPPADPALRPSADPVSRPGYGPGAGAVPGGACAAVPAPGRAARAGGSGAGAPAPPLRGNGPAQEEPARAAAHGESGGAAACSGAVVGAGVAAASGRGHRPAPDEPEPAARGDVGGAAARSGAVPGAGGGAVVGARGNRPVREGPGRVVVQGGAGRGARRAGGGAVEVGEQAGPVPREP